MVTSFALPTITGNNSFCVGGSTTLTSFSATGNLWSTGDTTQIIAVGIVGNYTVTLINEAGCSSATSLPIAISMVAAPIATAISRVTGTDSLRAALTTPSPTSYVWTFNGAILLVQ